MRCGDFDCREGSKGLVGEICRDCDLKRLSVNFTRIRLIWVGSFVYGFVTFYSIKKQRCRTLNLLSSKPYCSIVKSSLSLSLKCLPIYVINSL